MAKDARTVEKEDLLEQKMGVLLDAMLGAGAVSIGFPQLVTLSPNAEGNYEIKMVVRIAG
jgi:hypothetical protein